MLELDTARALITTSLDDDQLTEAITREEAWLARRVGPLSGSRTELFVPSDGDERLLLRRPTEAVSIIDDSGAVSLYDLRGWADVVRTSGAWSGEVLIDYDPSDADEVVRVLVTLLRLTLGESAYTAQAAQGYSSSVSVVEQKRSRYAALRSLMRPREPYSMRLRSAIPSGGRSASAVASFDGS